MANPLFQTLAGGRAPQVSDGGFGDMMQAFAQFRKGFRGDARAEVQRLMNSGQMSQTQYNQLAAMANQIMPMMR